MSESTIIGEPGPELVTFGVAVEVDAVVTHADGSTDADDTEEVA